MIFLIYVTMVYGPIAAFLVELFPTNIRYTSMSLPYHIGNGWFGGMLPLLATALVAWSGDIYFGLWYPIGVAVMTLVIGTLFLRETKDVDITSTSDARPQERTGGPARAAGFFCPIVIPSAARDLCGNSLFRTPTMNLDAIAIGHNPPEDVNTVIEVPIGGEPVKYEMDKAAGTLVVDRFLYTPMRYPGNYGFVPHTLSDDGDPIDVLVANTRPIIPGAVMNVRPIGVLRMEDDGGGDEKIIAVPSSRITQRYVNVKTHTDLPEITRHQIEHFFVHYKDLEPGKWVKLLGWGDVAEAHRLIAEAIERAKRK